MSHTDKDAPWKVRAERGTVVHDHATGKCVVGTWHENSLRARKRRQHRLDCPRYSTTVLCVHDHKRDSMQAAVEQARHTDAYYNPTWNVEFSLSWNADSVRHKTSVALTNMLNAGYIPNCDQAKTHEIDLDDLNLHLRPAEHVPVYDPDANNDTRTSPRWGLNLLLSARSEHAERIYTPDFLFPAYDPDVPCATCDALEPITCFLEPVASEQYWRRGYDDDEQNPHYDKRSKVRDNLHGLVASYNTFHEVPED